MTEADYTLLMAPAAPGLIPGAPTPATAFVFVRGSDDIGAILVEKNFPVDPQQSRVVLPKRFEFHSRGEGFGWAYQSAGSLDAAINILALFVQPGEAWRIHRYFAAEFLATIPFKGGRLEAEVVRTWLADRWDTERRFYPIHPE